MLRLLAVAAALSSFLPSPARAQDVLWTREIQNIFPSFEEVRALAPSTDAVYAAGVTAGDLEAPGSHVGGQDAFLARYAPDGNLVWLRQFGTTSTTTAAGVVLDSDGNPIVAGQTPSGLVSGASGRVFLRKFDPLGNVLWTRQFRVSMMTIAENVTAVAIEPQGTSTAGAIFIAGFEVFSPREAWISKRDAAGEEIWTRVLSQSGPENEASFTEALAVAVDASGRSFVAGSTLYSLTGLQGTNFLFLRCYDAAGEIVWTHEVHVDNSFLSDLNVSGVALDGTGVYVAGRAGTTTTGGFVAKHALEDGAELWRQGGMPEVRSLARGPGANLYAVTANTLRALSAETGAALQTTSYGSSVTGVLFHSVATGHGGILLGGRLTADAPPSQAGRFSSDTLVARTDDTGALSWFRSTGGLVRDSFRFDVSNVSASPDRIAWAGATHGWAEGQESVGSGTSRDLVVRVYDLDGKTQWTRQFNVSGTGNTQLEGSGLAMDEAGHVYVGGSANTRRMAFLRRYGPDGTELWTSTFATTGSIGSVVLQHIALQETTAGPVVYAAGRYTGNLPGGDPSGEGHDAFLRKYDRDGNLLWSRSFDDGSLDWVLGLSLVETASGTELVLLSRPEGGQGPAEIRRITPGGVLLSHHRTERGMHPSAWAGANASGVFFAGPIDGQTGLLRVEFSGEEVWFSSTSLSFFRDAAADSTGVLVARLGALQRHDANGTLRWSRPMSLLTGSRSPSSVTVISHGIYLSGNRTTTPGNTVVTRISVPAISVDPEAVDFGDVEVHEGTTAMVVVQNVGLAPLSVDAIEMQGGSEAMAVLSVSQDDAAVSLPAVLEEGEALHIELAFSPEEAVAHGGTLVLRSDDPVRGHLEIPLAGMGVLSTLTPDQMFQKLLDDVEAAAQSGTLVGTGKGASPAQRLRAFQNMLAAAHDIHRTASATATVKMLEAILAFVDGEPRPPDLVAGTAAPATAQAIRDLIAALSSSL